MENVVYAFQDISVKYLSKQDRLYLPLELRWADKVELQVSTGGRTLQSILREIEDECLVAWKGEEPFFVCGYSPNTNFKRPTRHIWLLGSDLILNNLKQFQIITKKILRGWSENSYYDFATAAYGNNLQHHKWLEKFKFSIIDRMFLKEAKAEFFYLYYRNNEEYYNSLNQGE